MYILPFSCNLIATMAVAPTTMLAAMLLLMLGSSIARPLGRELLQTTIVPPNTTGVALAGFTFGSEVGTYQLITLDVADIVTALSSTPPNFAAAMDIYELGKNAPGRNGTLRALKGFTTGAIYGTPAPFRLNYISYYNDLTFMESAVQEALELTPATTSAQVLKLVMQGLVNLNYMMHEVDAGLNKTEYQTPNNTDAARGAPHNLDEGWALYAGNGATGILPIVLAHSKAFGVMKDSADNTTCVSAVNDVIAKAFNNMYAAATQGKLFVFRAARNSLASHILIPFIQGTLKAAFDISKKVALKQSPAAAVAQGYGYWRAIEAVVAAADQDAADIVSEAFFFDEAPAADTFAKVKAALEGVYSKLGVKANLVGTLNAKQYLQCDGSKQKLSACLSKCPKAKLVCGADGKTYGTKCAALCYGTVVRKNGRC